VGGFSKTSLLLSYIGGDASHRFNRAMTVGNQPTGRYSGKDDGPASDRASSWVTIKKFKKNLPERRQKKLVNSSFLLMMPEWFLDKATLGVFEIF
jgi:hypothetical protein